MLPSSGDNASAAGYSSDPVSETCSRVGPNHNRIADRAIVAGAKKRAPAASVTRNL